MYFDKAKIIQAAQEKEKRRLIFKAWHFKVFLYNGLEIVNTYKYQRSKRKARRISKIRCSELSAVYKLKKRKKKKKDHREVCAWNHLHEQSSQLCALSPPLTKS